MLQKVTSELTLALALELTLSFQGTSRKVITYFLPYTSKEEKDKATSEPEQIIKLFNDNFGAGLKDYNIEQYGSYDKLILGMVKYVGGENAQIAKCIGNAVCMATFLGMANMSNTPILDFINQTIPMYKLNNNVIPDLGFVLFKTGKDMNSKVKFEKWILFLNNAKKLAYNDLKDMIIKLYNALKKFLTSGKGGESGMRLNPDGSYYPPIDSMNDILKLIENIIVEIGVSENFYIGIDCNGDTYYNKELNTYEMDGFKKPPDNDQLIDFYIKLCKEHSLLKYLEDPLSTEDLRGYSKLMDRFAEECPDVKIVIKRLVNNKII